MPRKNKKQPKKQKTPKRKQSYKSSPPAHASMSHVMGVCSLTNPFCPESVGSRWPDDSYTKSVGWSVTAMPWDLVTDATGNAARLYFPDQGAPFATGTVAAGVATYTGSYGIQVSPPAGVARWRLTSWGLRITSSLTPMNASGMVRVRLMSPLTGLTLGSLNITTPLADAVYDVPVARLLNKDLFVVPAALGVNARTFRDPVTTAVIANWVNPGWQVVHVAVTGGPASQTAVTVSSYYNYELIFGDGEAATLFAQPPPQNSPALRNGVAAAFEKVGNFVEGTVQTIDRVYQSAAGRMAVNAAARYALGPVGGTAVGMLMNAPFAD